VKVWEAAILIIGGLWLVGRMARASASSPLNKVSTVSAVGTVGPQGNTVATNEAGTSYLIAGEPLTPAGPPILPPIMIGSDPVTSLPVRAPVVPRPVGIYQGGRPVATPIKATPGRFTAL
jgi:hypothetical protein